VGTSTLSNTGNLNIPGDATMDDIEGDEGIFETLEAGGTTYTGGIATHRANIDATGYTVEADSFSITGSGIQATMHYDSTQHGVVISSKTIIDGPLVVNGDFDGNGNCIEDVCSLTVSSESSFGKEHHDFAEVNTTSGTTAITLTTQNVWYQIKVLVSTGEVNGMTTGANEIIVSTAGIYLIYMGGDWQCSAKDKTIQFGLFANNGAKEFGNVRFRQYTNGANTPQTTGKVGFVDLAVGDSLEVWARCTCSGGNTVTPIDFSLIATKQ